MRQPSAMPWPLSAVNSGPRRLSPPPRITERYRNSQPTCSTAFCSSPADRPDLQSQAKVRARAVRMVFDHQGEHASQAAAISSIATKIGCAPETLRGWVRQTERDQGRRPGPPTAEQERTRALERETRELRKANEILPKASAYFAMAELDRRSKP